MQKWTLKTKRVPYIKVWNRWEILILVASALNKKLKRKSITFLWLKRNKVL